MIIFLQYVVLLSSGEVDMDYNKLCIKCMHEKENEECEYCGFGISGYKPEANVIPAPSVLNGRYLLGLPLGKGGFGVTYIAYDLIIGGICAIKEYLPETVSYRKDCEQQVSVSESKLEDYRYGLMRFTEEARMLMKFSKSRNIISILDCFEENNTAYYVMEYLQGQDLRTYTNGFRTKLDIGFGLKCLFQVMDGLEEIHSQNIIHRDISPDNIYITHTGDIKLLDFGAARYSISQNNRNLSVILKMGYAPPEQYGTKIQQGPWTDIYALGATFYHLFSGIDLPEATDRTMGEQVLNLRQANHMVPEILSQVIHKAVSLSINERFHSIQEIRNALAGLTSLNSNNEVTENSGRGVKAQETYRRNNSTEGGSAVMLAESPVKLSAEVKSGNRIQSPVISRAPMAKMQNNLFGARLVAYLIDLVLSVVLGILFVLLVGVMLASMNMLDGVGQPIMWAILIFTPLLLSLMNSTLECSRWKGTIGKRITGIRTVAIDGSTLNSSASIKRNFIKLLGIMLLLTEKNGMYLHDRKAHSKVVRHLNLK